MSANEELFHATIRHAIAVRRFSTGEVKDILALIEKSDEDLIAQILQRMHEGDTLGSRRLRALLGDLRDLRAELWKELQKRNERRLIEFAGVEAESQLRTLQAVIPFRIEFAVVSSETLQALVTTHPFAGGTNAAQTLEQWWNGLSVSDQQRRLGAIQLGISQNESIPSIVGRVQKVSDLSRFHAEAVVRTVVNHVSNASREAFFQIDPNAEIADAMRWNSTLDGRTTAICRARDGHYAPLTEEPISYRPLLVPPTARPPAHVSCRSVMSVVLSPEKVAGILDDRPFVRDARTRRQREMDFRADAKEKAGSSWKNLDEVERRVLINRLKKQWAVENIGQVPATMNYDQWLRLQPIEFQNEVLGIAKAQMFRKGLRLDQYVDRRGSELTIDELRARFPEAN